MSRVCNTALSQLGGYGSRMSRRQRETRRTNEDAEVNEKAGGREGSSYFRNREKEEGQLGRWRSGTRHQYDMYGDGQGRGGTGSLPAGW
jgi:hypothetical protein